MGSALSNGYKKPVNPDTGDTFWNDLATDIQLMNDHVHDGTKGNVLPMVSQNILSAAWSAVAGQAGTYSQVVTLPAQFSYATVEIGVRLTNGTKIYPTITQVSSSQYTVFTNDNTQAFVAEYSS